MRQQIVRLSVHQTSKVLAVMYALMGLIFVPIFLIAAAVNPQDGGIGLGLALIFPILYGILGYVFVAVGCALYNAVASRFGGVEFVLRTNGESAAS